MTTSMIRSRGFSEWLFALVATGFGILAATPLAAQKVGLSDPFDANLPEVSLGYTYFDGEFDASAPVALEGESSDDLRLRQHVVGARLSQQFFGRVQVHADGAVAENRLDESRFDQGPVYGGGVQVLLIPDPDLYLKWVGSYLVHDEVALRSDDDTRMRIRNDWHTGFLLGREGGAQPLIGEEFTGSRSYIGAVFSAREIRVRSDRTETFEHEEFAGMLGLVGIQLDIGPRAGFAVEGHLGAAQGASGWIYYRF